MVTLAARNGPRSVNWTPEIDPVKKHVPSREVRRGAPSFTTASFGSGSGALRSASTEFLIADSRYCRAAAVMYERKRTRGLIRQIAVERTRIAP
jgi:hypothetical protein